MIRHRAPKAKDFTNRRYRHCGVVDLIERAKNRTKSKVRARVEHSIGVFKWAFGCARLRYRGLNKTAHRLLVTCALTNLFIARRHLSVNRRSAPALRPNASPTARSARKTPAPCHPARQPI
jgi:transposase, IS5 family